MLLINMKILELPDDILDIINIKVFCNFETLYRHIVFHR